MTPATATNGHKGAIKDTQEAGVTVTIKAPNFQTAQFKVVGLKPLVVHKFSQKNRDKIQATQSEGAKAKSKKTRTPKDFEKDYQSAKHISLEGWEGIPVMAFKSAMISACRATEYKMTSAKTAILYVEADGEDASEIGTGLIRISGTAIKDIRPARNANGSVDLRSRPMYKKWSAIVRVKFDADMLSVESIANLLTRAGEQVGICEGRPGSKDSNGCGWGTFKVEGKA